MPMLAFIQAAEFWPTSLKDWVYIALAVAGAVGYGWAFVKRPIMEKVNAVGARLNDHLIKHTAEHERSDTRLDALERTAELARLDNANMREALTRLSVEVQTLVRLTQEGTLARVEELGEIRERLVRIETKVDARRKGGGPSGQ